MSLSPGLPDQLRKCVAVALVRVEVWDSPDHDSLQGCEYACLWHAPEVVAAIEHTGAVAEARHPGEYEAAHSCGDTVNYAGRVLL